MGVLSHAKSEGHPSMETVDVVDSVENEDAQRKFFIRQITGMFDMVEREYGNRGLKLLEQLARGDLTTEELRAELEVAPNFREFQEGAREYLESRGLIEYEGNVLFADIDRIRKLSLSFPGERQTFGKKPEENFLKKFEVFHGNSTLKFLFSAFQGQKVVDLEEWAQYEQGKLDDEPQARELFYSPQNLDAAFDKEQICAAQFHLGPWEMPVGGLEDDLYPGTVSKIPFFEASIACMIYHPNYGNGQRDRLGQLQVQYETGKTKKINHEFFDQYRGAKIMGRKLFETPRQFLLDGEFPHMQKAGLLKPNDFRYISTNEKSKYDLSRDITHPKGHVMFEGVRYSLGSKYAPQIDLSYRIYKISESQAGIVEVDRQTGEESLVALFDLLPNDPNNPIRQKAKEKQRFPDVVQGETNLRAYSLNKTENRNVDDKSFSAGKEFSTFIEARQRLHKESDLDIMSLRPEEQGQFIQFLQKETGDQKRFYQFAKQFGLEGIRSFFATTRDEQAAQKILSIGERYSFPQAAAIFEKYAEFLDATLNIEEELSGFASKDIDRQQLNEIVTEKLLDRAGEMLTKYAGEKEQPAKIRDFLAELERFQTEAILFGTLFKSIYKGKEKIDLNEIHQFEFSSRLPRDISETDKQDMMDVIIENMKSEGEYGKTLVANLRRALSDESDKVNFYLLKKKGKVVAFVRFFQQHDQDGKPIPGRKGGGSFNVVKSEQGYAFGEAMLLNAIKVEAEKNTVDAFVDPQIDIGTRYVEDTGCDVTGVMEVGGKKVFKLLCSLSHTEKSFSRKEDKNTIIDEYRRSHVSVEDRMKQNASRIVCRFDPQKDESHILLTTQKLCANEYRGVRYFEDPENKQSRYYVFELDEQKRKERLHQNLQLQSNS